MGLFDHFPYTNFHDLNLDWILKILKEIDTTMDQFVAINSLKYADPIQWDITSQYEKNTIVIDPQTGTAYISVNAVPTGVSLSNPDYWTVIFDLSDFVIKAAKNLANIYEDGSTTAATVNIAANDWLIWGETLYKALVNINAGDSYIIDSNIKKFTIEDVIGHLEDLNTIDKTNLVVAINETLQNIINEAARVDSITGNLVDLNTDDKSNIVAAINELTGDISRQTLDNIIGLTGYQIDDDFSYQLYYVDITGSSTFNAMQGGCYNPIKNTFVIGFLEAGNETNGVLVELQEDLRTVVQRVFYPNGEIRHCNDMTYNTTNNKIYIAGYTTNSTNNSIIEVDPTDLSIIQEYTLAPAVDAGHAIGKITYDEVNDRYITMSNFDIMIIDNGFNLISTTPYTFANFAINTAVTVNFSPLQSIQFYQGKIFALYTVMNMRAGSASVVMYNLDGEILATFPVHCGIIGLESESISLYKGKLKVLIGGDLGLFSTNFNISNAPYSNIGESPYQMGVDLNNSNISNLNDLYKSGCYYVATPTSITNSPFKEAFTLYCLPTGAGYLQIAVAAAARNFIALRKSNYVGTWNAWEYYPELLVEKGNTYTTPNAIACAMLSGSGVEMAYYVDIGSLQSQITASDITVNSFSFYTATANGTLNITNSGNHIVSKSIIGNMLQLVIGKDDGTAYGAGNFGTPAIGLGQINFTVTV